MSLTAMGRSSMLRRLRLFVFAVPTLLLAGCISGVPVSVTNHSSAELTHVTVTGKGISEDVGRIAAGATETIRVRPREATTIKVAFEAAGHRYSATTEGEIENDDVNVIVATFGEDMSLSIEARLR